MLRKKYLYQKKIILLNKILELSKPNVIYLIFIKLNYFQIDNSVLNKHKKTEVWLTKIIKKEKVINNFVRHALHRKASMGILLMELKFIYVWSVIHIDVIRKSKRNLIDKF